MIGLLLLTVDLNGALQSPPTLALVQSGGGPKGPLPWELTAAKTDDL